jgi:hypothetical protein
MDAFSPLISQRFSQQRLYVLKDGIVRRPLIKFVWDTSAIINIKEPDHQGYSAGNSLMKDLFDGWSKGPYLNIFPSIAMFEVSATVARKRREGTLDNKVIRHLSGHLKVIDLNDSIAPANYRQIFAGRMAKVL